LHREWSIGSKFLDSSESLPDLASHLVWNAFVAKVLQLLFATFIDHHHQYHDGNDEFSRLK